MTKTSKVTEQQSAATKKKNSQEKKIKKSMKGQAGAGSAGDTLLGKRKGINRTASLAKTGKNVDQNPAQIS